MAPELLRIVAERDESGLERAYFDNTCPHFFSVDWREDDADIVEYCARYLKLDSLSAEWRGDALYISFGSRGVRVPLQMEVGDRHITLCALNELLNPDYELRFLVCSHGSDTLGIAGLRTAEWRELEAANAVAVEESFLDPRKVPNLVTELTDATLPTSARARHQRMVERYRHN